eukprot:3371439-Heterocapsa_arctica.AAC.1
MQVDYWRQPNKKDLGGYSGPATITDIEADKNKVTIRWQGVQVAAAINQLREHTDAILFDVIDENTMFVTPTNAEMTENTT